VEVANASPSIEQAAQRASSEQSRQADVRILCLESTRPPNNWERSQLQHAAGGATVVVLTKIDVGRPADSAGAGSPSKNSCATASPEAVPSLTSGEALLAGKQWHTAVPTSSVTGEGIDSLRDRLRDALLTAGACGAEVVAGTAVRCRESLRLAAASLKRARQIARRGNAEELVAAEVRVVLDELGKVAGTVYTEDVLERIFSRFCIGK
jgi:tRNA U34 5-carboxymethylaminomethyl modifying GTPase MnmE/TrmE